MTERTVLQERDGHVLRLVLNRPEAKNAFNNDMYVALAKAIRDADQDRAVRAIIITGGGNVFCAGQDLHEMTALGDGDGDDGFDQLLDALTACESPVLVAINGPGVGIGCTMLLHTDLNYIAQGARLRLPFVPLGVVPEAASTLLLPRRMGAQRTAEVLFTGRWISSSEAVAFGLALEEVAADALQDSVMNVARQLAKQPPDALRNTKRLLRDTTRAAVRDTLARETKDLVARIGSPENIEAITAFFEKREPKFD